LLKAEVVGITRETVKILKEQEPEFSNPTSARRFTLWQEILEQELELVEFNWNWRSRRFLLVSLQSQYV
jgi:hypothetical protein